MARHAVPCYLVNTGWSGGHFGVGSRMPIALTRALVRAAVDGHLRTAPTRREPFFGLQVPLAVPGIPPERLDPRETWSDRAAYDAQARRLAAMFRNNFAEFDGIDQRVREAGPPG
jgi:phosphoenolpyruvate carboxykinase (ATP)